MTSRGSGRFRCKGKCHRLPGYEKGMYRFKKYNKKWCSECDYKIVIRNPCCPCCGCAFRRNNDIDYSNELTIAVVKRRNGR